MMGLGLINGDWQEDQKYNKKILYKIEPVVESLLQVRQDVTMSDFTWKLLQIFVQGVMLYTVFGSGDTSKEGNV